MLINDIKYSSEILKHLSDAGKPATITNIQEELNAIKAKEAEKVEAEKQNTIPEYEEEATPAQTVEVSGDTTNNFANIDLGTGVIFNPDQINSEMAAEFDPTNPSRAFLQDSPQYPQMPVQQQPMYPQPVYVQPGYPQQPYPQQQPFYPSQPVMVPVQQTVPVMIPVDGGCTDPNCGCHDHNQPSVYPPIHKVDEPPKAPVKKAEEDKINVDLEKIDVDKKPPVVKQTPDFIAPIPQAEQVQAEPVINMFDNTPIANKFNKIPLLELQAIANNHNCHVQMTEMPNEMISVVTYDHATKQANPIKSFTIDPGMIIDKRIKIIAANYVIGNTGVLELAPIYELFTTDMNNHNRKILDQKLINDIFYAGFGIVTKKEMYTDNYKVLNTKVALITLPTKGLNKEERNALQEYVMKMEKDGYLDAAIKKAPGSRFAFITKQLDKSALSNFVLINQGVPPFYGYPVNNVVPVIIESKDGNINIRTNQ